MSGVGFVKDERGISQIIVVALLIAVAVVGVAVVAAFMGGLMNFEKPPSAQFKVSDHPDVVTNAGANAFVVRHLGGDRIQLSDIILTVYDSDRNLLFNKDVATAQSDGNVTLNQFSATGYDNNFLEGGEQIIAKAGTSGVNVSAPGTYEVVLYYKPTMQPIVDQKVMIS